MRTLLKELKALKGRTLLSFHSLADVDAVASAIGLAELLPQAVVKAPDKPASAARKLLEAVGLSFDLLERSELSAYDNAVLVDVSTAGLLGGFGTEFEAFARAEGKKLVCVDHHLHTNRIAGASVHSFAHRSSCSEVVFELLALNGKPLRKEVALALAAGIAADTALFSSGNAASFRAFCELMEFLEKKGVSYAQVQALASPASALSEKIAIAKALKSAEFYAIGKGESRVLAGVAPASACELACALALLPACDYGFAFNEKEGRVSAVRSRHCLSCASVGKLMEVAGKAMGGSGGGHEAVGGASGKPGAAEAAVRECVRLVADSLHTKAVLLKGWVCFEDCICK